MIHPTGIHWWIARTVYKSSNQLFEYSISVGEFTLFFLIKWNQNILCIFKVWYMCTTCFHTSQQHHLKLKTIEFYGKTFNIIHNFVYGFPHTRSKSHLDPPNDTKALPTSPYPIYDKDSIGNPKPINDLHKADVGQIHC